MPLVARLAVETSTLARARVLRVLVVQMVCTTNSARAWAGSGGDAGAGGVGVDARLGLCVEWLCARVGQGVCVCVCVCVYVCVCVCMCLCVCACLCLVMSTQRRGMVRSPTHK